MMEPLGPKIRRQRRRLGLTLDELAGGRRISKPYLSLIETGRVPNPPSDEKLRRLEQTLGFTAGRAGHARRISSARRATCGRCFRGSCRSRIEEVRAQGSEDANKRRTAVATTQHPQSKLRLHRPDQSRRRLPLRRAPGAGRAARPATSSTVHDQRGAGDQPRVGRVSRRISPICRIPKAWPTITSAARTCTTTTPSPPACTATA